MNAYDQAHELARTLKASDEYRVFLDSRKQLEADPKNKEMLDDLRRLQWEMEMAQAMGKEVDEAKQKQAGQLVQLVTLNPTLKDYLGAEYRFAQLMADVQKILADALTEWFSAAGDIFKKTQQ
ncbi:MAG: YlbF family regulator [Thermacetogeniaceae bacterium]